MKPTIELRTRQYTTSTSILTEASDMSEPRPPDYNSTVAGLGRNTRALHRQVPSDATTFAGHSSEALIVKVSWISSCLEDTRIQVPEAELIPRVVQRVTEKAHGDISVVVGYPPVGFFAASKACHGYPTIHGPPRIMLSSTVDEDVLEYVKPSRALRSFVSHKLEAIERLQSDGAAFLKAFFEIEQCTPRFAVPSLLHADPSDHRSLRSLAPFTPLAPPGSRSLQLDGSSEWMAYPLVC
ncbi:hypothetical protein C8Q76DRAFT_732353 [Earliella scabrosa]|nr:hypothetical protein C8Q76DRAFT_732353 [Earliella scabrosa]